MEVSFDVDINLDEDNNHSNDDCELHNDYDNQKLFHIYESYLNRSDISDSESEPELSFSDQFYELVSNKSNKTPITNRTIRQISCFADIESQTPRISRKSSANNESIESTDDSMSDLTLPWNLKEMTEQQVIDLAKNLEEEILNKEMSGPNIAAKHMKDIYDKRMEFFKQMSEESEIKFRDCLQKICLKSDEQRLDFNELIGKQLESNKSKSEELSKLIEELNIIQMISKK